MFTNIVEIYQLITYEYLGFMEVIHFHVKYGQIIIVQYDRNTLSLTLSEQLKPKVFQNREIEDDVQILEEGREQGSRKWRSEESREFCSPANIIWVMKNKRI